VRPPEDVARLPERVAGPAGNLRLDRAWPRSGEHLLLRFVDATGRAVAGQWFADPERLTAVAAATGPLSTALPADGVLLQPAGVDRRLTALTELVSRPGAELLAHRPERRAVVRLAGPTYLKLVRPGHAPAIRAAAQRASTLSGGPVRMPQICGHDDARGVLGLSALPGRTVLDVGRVADPAELHATWTSVGHAVDRLHDGPQEGFPSHDAAAELGVVTRWLRLAAGYGVLPGPTNSDPVAAALLGVEASPLGLLHRDLHDKQLLVCGPDEVGMLDVDTLAVGERALDLGNLLAHLRLRTLQGALSGGGARTARTALLAAVGPAPATVRRLAVYEMTALLRLAAVYAFRPRWQAMSRELLRQGLAAQDGLCTRRWITGG